MGGYKDTEKKLKTDKREVKEKKPLYGDFETPMGPDIEEPVEVKENYYERILKNSRDQNTALRIKSFDIAEQGNWTVTRPARPKDFIQKLPAARDSYKERKAENAAIDEAKKTFLNADFCTVREKASLEEYFKNWKNGDPGVTGKDKVNDRELMDFVDSILSVELSNAILTDDYLSDHVVELFEYNRKLKNVDLLKRKYPKFYENLKDEKKALIETRVAASGELGALLKKHMELHGIVLERDTSGFKVKLRKESEDKRTRNAERERMKQDYENMRKGFLTDRVYEDEVNLARTYTKNNNFRMNKAVKDLKDSYAGFEKAHEVMGDKMQDAMNEMQNAWQVRDLLLVETESLLRRYDKEKNESRRDTLKAQIARNNRRIRLSSAHADHYRDFLNFVTGQTPAVKVGTAKFLEAENKQELLDIIRFKALGDCLEEGLSASEKINAKKQLEKLKKDIEIKQAGDFEMVDYKEENKEQIRALEEQIKNTTYLKMPMDTFYARYAEFTAAKRKSERYKELEDISNKNLNMELMRAKNFANKKGLARCKGNDRVITIFLDPFNEETKRAMSLSDDLNAYEALAVFSGYLPEGQTSVETREQVIKGVQPFIDELLNMTPEKMLALQCPKDPNIEDPAFWHNRSLAMMAHDMGSLLDRIDNWGISITKEQRAHLTALGKMGEYLTGSYDAFNTEMVNPMALSIRDEKLTGKTLEDLYENVFFPLYDETEVPDKEAGEKLTRYGKDKAGLSLQLTRKQSKQKKDTVLNAVSYFVVEAYGDQVGSAASQLYQDPSLYYKQKKQEALDSINDVEFEAEKRRQQAYYPDITDAEIRYFLSVRDTKKLIDRSFTKEQQDAWKRYFGNFTGGGADIRSFRILLRPVKYNSSGVPETDSFDNMRLNEMDINDYISGDEKRRNRVLRRIGKDMAAIEITDEMLTFEYMQKNPDKLRDVMQKIHGFQNIHAEYPDFFESDAFTEEERDKIRKTLTDSRAFTNLLICFGSYVSSFGVSEGQPNDEVKKPEHLKTSKEKQDWGRQQKEMFTNMARIMFEDDSADGVVGALNIQKKREAMYETKADEIRRASVLYAKLKARKERVLRERNTVIQRKSALPESAKKAAKIAALNAKETELDAELKSLDNRLRLTEEIKNWIYGEKDAISDEARKLFETEGVDTVIHVETAPEVVLKKEEQKPVKQDEVKAEPVKAPELTEEEMIDKQSKDLTGAAIFSALSELEEEAGEELKEEKEKPLEEMKAENLKFLPLPEYHVSAGLATQYEQQDTNNCWACTGAALFNKFVQLQDGEVKDPVTQYDIRGFRPKENEMKTLEQIHASGVELEQKLYDKYRTRMLDYMGSGREAHGNIFEVADFFMKKRTDFAINRMLIHLPGYEAGKDQPPKTEEDKVNDRIRHYNQKVAFIEKLNEVLSTGNLVGFYFESGRHYVTITKLNGNIVSYMDSSGNTERHMSVDDMLERGAKGVDVELTWFSPLKGHDELLNEYPLLYNEQTGEYSPETQSMEEALNIAHTRGVLVGKNDRQLGEKMEGISIATYFPKYRNQQAGGEQMRPPLQQEDKKQEQKQEQKREEKREEQKQQEKKPEQKQKAPVWKASDKKEIQAHVAKFHEVYHSRDEMIRELDEKRPPEWHKGRNNISNDRGRQAKEMAGCLTYFAGDSKEQSWQLYSGLMINTESATPQQKKAKSRAYEHVFETILEFDVRKFDIKHPNDLLTSDHFDTALIAMMSWDIQPWHFADYRKLMEDKASGCALNEEQLQEAEAKWEFMHVCGGWFYKYPELAGMISITEQDIEKVFSMEPEAIMREQPNLGSKELSDFYIAMFILKSIKDVFGYQPGVDMTEFYSEWRKKHKLNDKDNTEDALNAIRTRVEKEGELPREESDHDMTEQELAEKKKREAEARKKRQEDLKKQEAEARKKRQEDQKKREKNKKKKKKK